MSGKELDITIGNKVYRLVVEESQQARVKSVAAKFEEYVRKFQEAGGMDRDRVLVMAGITMADDFLSTETEKDTHEKSIDAFHNTLAERIEQMINKTPEA